MKPRETIRKPWRPRTVRAYAVYDGGNRLIDCCHYRRDVVCEVERRMGEPWSKCRRYLRIYRVTVIADDWRWEGDA